MIDFLYYCYNAWPYLVIAAAVIALAVRSDWFRVQQMKHVPAKDYLDFSTTHNNSTEWVGQSFCRKCNQTLGGYLRSPGVCPHCGAFVGDAAHEVGMRAYRTIWDGSKWLHQYRYRSDKIDLRRTPL